MKYVRSLFLNGEDCFSFSATPFLISLIILIFYSCGPREFERPNIIVIMADDLGYGDLGCYGNEKIKTPALDKLAAEGLKFMDFHSNGAVCTPTRAALLTGKYQQRSGLEGVIYAKGETRQAGLDVKEITFADFLKQAGYTTGIIGKWHLGYYIQYNPIYQGFDYFKGFVSGNVDYQSHLDGAGIPDWWQDLEKEEEPGYVTDLITKASLEFIQKNKDQPFCLFISHAAPHYPYQRRKDKADRRPGINFPAQGSTLYKPLAYKEMIEVMDEGIGEIIQLLEYFDLKNKTLVFFCSDNGGLQGMADNGILRGAKGSLWEGGQRVPAIAYWPGYIEPGTSTNELVMSMDLFPTFVNLSKAETTHDFKFDGIDITRLMIEEKSLPDRTVFWRYRNQKVARNDKWKLLIDGDTTHLYNLKEDIMEKIDLASSEPGIVSELKTEFDSWEMSVSQGIKMKTE